MIRIVILVSSCVWGEHTTLTRMECNGARPLDYYNYHIIQKTRTVFPPLLLQSKWDAFDNLLTFSLYERKLTQETQ